MSTPLDSRKTIGFYAGSFDPITLGHLDVVRKALKVFDYVHIAIGRNPKKKGTFSEIRRVGLIEASLNEIFPAELKERITIGTFQGSLMDGARHRGATAIVRGLRQISDFNDEFALHGIVEQTAPDIPVTYLICQQQYLHVSSSSAKELAFLGHDTSWMVAPSVSEALRNVVEASNQ